MTTGGQRPFSGAEPALSEGSAAGETTVNLRLPVELEEDDADVDKELVRELSSFSGDTSVDISLPTEEIRGADRDAAEATALALQLRREAGAASSARRGAALLYELGRLYETRLARPDAAEDAYRESHDRFPGLTVSARALVRLLAARGEHSACLPVLEAEWNATTATEERLAVLVQRATIRLIHLSDPDGARQDLLRASKIDPQDPLVQDGLEEVYRRTGETAELEALLQRRARAVDDPALRSAMLCQVARLREKMSDAEGAVAHLRSALNTLPSNLYALQALLRTARATRDYPAVAKLDEALAALQSGAYAAALLAEAGRLYRDRLRNPTLAIAAMEQALEHTPKDGVLLVELADLYAQEKRWPDLAQVLERALAQDDPPPPPAEASNLAYRLAQVRHDRLHDLDGSVAALRQAVGLLPDNVPARRMLGRLYAKREQWADLAGLLAEELTLFSDAQRRAATAFRIGEIQELKLEDPERAIAAYQQALALQPGFRPAIRGLSRVYTRLGRHEDLVAACEQQLARTLDREERIQLLRRVADLWEQHLGDPAAALSSYERLVAIDPSNSQAINALHRLYAVGNRWSDLVTVLKTDADQTMDRWRRVALLVEAAEVLERNLDDAEAALQTHLEVLDLAPSHQPSLMAAGRILQARGRLDELLQLHRREYEHTEDAQHRVWLLMKIGRLLAEGLGRTEEAAEVYQEVMTLAGQSAAPGAYTIAQQAAADQLFRIYRQTGRHAELLALLQRRPVPTSGPALALHHRQLAEVLQHSQRPALAVEHLRRAAAAGDDDAAFYHLAQLYSSIGDRQSMIQLYAGELERTADARGKVVILFRLAHLWTRAEHDLDRAVEAHERILNLDPQNRVAMQLMKELLARLEQWDRLAAVLELMRYPNDDQDHRVACALVIAALKEDRLDDLPGAAHAAFQVLEHLATHPEALDTLERHYRETANSDGLVQLLGRLAKASQSAAEQAALLTALASCHGMRDETAKAAEVFQLALQATPTYLPASRGWYRAAQRLADPAGMARALELQAAGSRDPLQHAECLYQAGQVWHLRAANQDRAIACYRLVRERDPRHRPATEALLALHTSRREWSELAALLEQVADLSTEPKEAKDVLARLADLQRSRLGDLTGARRSIGRALQIDPDDLPLLTALAELCRAEGDYMSLAQVDHRLVALTSDPVLLKALHFELGLIWEEKMDAPSKAIDEYRKVLELDQSDLGALTRLSSLLVREEDWMAAARATELLVQRDDDRSRLKTYHLRLARIYQEGFGDLRSAVEACRRALALDPGDPQATEAMSALLTQARDVRSLNAHLATVLAVHRGRIERDPFRVESYRSILDVFRWQKTEDRIYVARSLLDVLGTAGEDDRAYLLERRLQAQAPPARPLTPEETEAILLHPDERGTLYQFLQASEPVLYKLLAPRGSQQRGTRIAARSHPRLTALLSRLTRDLGVPALAVHQVEGGLEQLGIDPVSSALVIGEDLLEELEDPQIIFALSRMVARVRLHHAPHCTLNPDQLGHAVAAMLWTTCHSYTPPYPEAELEELRATLEKTLGKRARRQLESAGLELSDHPIEPARWLATMSLSEDRLALAVSGDVQAALRLVLRAETVRLQAGPDTPETLAASAGPRFRQMLSFALSEEYLTLRERLEMAVPS